MVGGVLDFVALGAQLIGHGVEGGVVEVGDTRHGPGHVNAVGAACLERYERFAWLTFTAECPCGRSLTHLASEVARDFVDRFAIKLLAVVVDELVGDRKYHRAESGGLRVLVVFSAHGESLPGHARAVWCYDGSFL